LTLGRCAASVTPASEITYIVSGGALNSAHSVLTHSLTPRLGKFTLFFYGTEYSGEYRFSK